MELERSATDAEGEGSSPSWGTKGIVAQSVEQGPEKPCVTGSIPVDPTILLLIQRSLKNECDILSFLRILRGFKLMRGFQSCTCLTETTL